MIKKGLVIIAGLFVVLAVVGVFLPGQYGLSRSVTIDAEPKVVFHQVANLRAYQKWMPWNADPTMKVTFGDKVEGVGASMSWTSEDSGNGKLIVSVAEPPTMIGTKLEFEGQGEAGAVWTFAPTEKGTLVTWTMSGEARGQIDRWVGLFMERIVGPEFERGLENLRRQSEAASSSTTSQFQ